MDFSRTRLCQRTRSRYNKIYLEFNEKKKAERTSGVGSVGRESTGGRGKAEVSGSDRDESSGKSSKGLGGNDGSIVEINAKSPKARTEVMKEKRELGKSLKIGKNVSAFGLIDESEDDGVEFNKSSGKNRSKFETEQGFGSGKIEKKLERGKAQNRGKNVGRNRLIDESEDDSDGAELRKSSGRNQSKLEIEGGAGSRKLDKKLELEKKLKRGKNVSKDSLTDKSEDEDDNDDEGVELTNSTASNQSKFELEVGSGSGKIEKKFERGFVDNETTASDGICLKEKGGLRKNFKQNKCVRTNGSLDESDDDDGVTYLGDNITCLDDCAPSNSSRVESNEVKVGVVELDSFGKDDGHDDSLEVESSGEDDDDSQELESSEEDEDDSDDTDFIVIGSSSSDSEDSEEEKDDKGMEDSDDDDSSVQEMESVDGTRNKCLTQVGDKSTSDKEDDDEEEEYYLEQKFVDEHGKKNVTKKDDEKNVVEPGLGKKRCSDGMDKEQIVEGGLKKRRIDGIDFLLDCGKEANEECRGHAIRHGSHFRPLCKSNEKKLKHGGVSRPIAVDDFDELDFSTKDESDGGIDENFMHKVHEKGSGEAGKSAGRKYYKFGKKIDVIKILTDSIREEGGGDKLLQKFVCPPEETPVSQILSYKFRFDDEQDMKPEIPEPEMELDGLFDEMNMCLQLSEIGFSDAPVVNIDDGEFPVEKTDQAALCRLGKHRLTINDEFGIMCRCCSHVEIEIREILPPLSKNIGGGRDRHDFEKADSVKLSDLQWQECGHEYLDGYKMCKYEKGTVWDLIPGVQDTMYPHQREGFEFIWKKIAGGTHIEKLEKHLPYGGSGCIISHAPGTGKSRLTIVFLQAFMKMYPNSKPLIIAPRCMLLTWEEEFEKWGVDIPFYNMNKNEFSGQEDTMAVNLLKQAGIHGKNVRCLRLLKLYSWKKKSSILGITYRLFENLAGEEGKRKQVESNPEDEEIKRILLQVPTLLVLDEGHTPRNDQSLVWKALLNVKTKRCIILSGTPFQNNFDELYNTLCLVNPLLCLGISSIKSGDFSRKLGRKGNAAKGQWDSITSSIGKSQHKLSELRALIDPFVHVHKGSILQERLPGLRDALVVLKPTNMQQTLLRNLRGPKCNLENDHLLSLISVHPSLLSKTDSVKEGFRKVLENLERNPHAGVKTNFLMEFIRLSEALNERVLVFSQYLMPLEFIMELLKTKFDWVEGREILYMDGKQEEKHRQCSINNLNDPKSDVKVLLASLRACSEGINLVGASRVVLLDVHWNPSVERQAISRAYRLGQKKLVHVYHLVTGSMEGEKYVRQVEKSHLSELVFSSRNRNFSESKISSTVSEDKILEAMVQHDKLRGMFEKVIYQPKESDLVRSFG